MTSWKRRVSTPDLRSLMTHPRLCLRSRGRGTSRTCMPETSSQRGMLSYRLHSMMSLVRSMRGIDGAEPWPGSQIITLMWPWSRNSMLTCLIQKINLQDRSGYGASWLSLMLQLLTSFWRPPWFRSHGSDTPLTRSSITHIRTRRS